MFDFRPLGKTQKSLSIFGMGGTGISNMYAPTERADAINALQTAWEAGTRYFDTAPFYGYGLSERRLGDFLREKPRDEFVLSTKVGRLLVPGKPIPNDDIYYHSGMPFGAEFDYSYDGVMRSFEDSLQRLGLHRIDTLYIHDIGDDTHSEETHPHVFKTAMEGAYVALDKLRAEGLISAIGLGVNEWRVCEAAVKYGDFDCFLLAGRFTLLEQTALTSFLPMCQDRNISVVVGGVFNSGMLVDPFAEHLTYEYAAAPQHLVHRAQEIAEVCTSFNVPIAAAALQYPLRHPAISSVLSGPRSLKEVEEISRWITMPIPDQMWSVLEEKGFIEASLANQVANME